MTEPKCVCYKCRELELSIFWADVEIKKLEAEISKIEQEQLGSKKKNDILL